MKLNLTDEERSRLGNANLDAFFAHVDFLMDNPDAIQSIPDGATIVIKTGDPWADAQNQLIAEQRKAKGVEIFEVEVPQTYLQGQVPYSGNGEKVEEPSVVKDKGAEYSAKKDLI